MEKAGGMSLSQSFGAASSYARKYALNGMFLIDDSVDDDQRPPATKVSKTSKPATTKPAPATKVSKSKTEQLQTIIQELNGCDPQSWQQIVPFKTGIHKDKTLEQLTTTDEGVKLIAYLAKLTDKQTNPTAGYILDSATAKGTK